MKKLTIYDVYVEMQDQAQCDRMKQLCVDNGLEIWNDNNAFYFHERSGNQFYYTINPDVKGDNYGFVILFDSEYNTKVTELEFIELLKNK